MKCMSLLSRKDKNKGKKKKKQQRSGVNSKFIRIIVFSFFGLTLASFFLAFSRSSKVAEQSGRSVIGRLGTAPGQFFITSKDFKDKDKPVIIDVAHQLDHQSEDQSANTSAGPRQKTKEDNFRTNLKDSGYANEVVPGSTITQGTSDTSDRSRASGRSQATNASGSVGSTPVRNSMLPFQQRNLSPNTTGLYASLQGPDAAMQGNIGQSLLGNNNSFLSGLGNMVNNTLSSTVPGATAKPNIANPMTQIKEQAKQGNVLGTGLVKAVSDRIIQAGSIIPITMITGINSALPGDIIGQVSKNIYDSIRGQYLLIPAGSKLLGNYANSVLFGQKRLFVAWTRLILPDGSSIDLQNMNGIDVEGYAGYSDKVDEHWDKILLALGITTLINISNVEINEQISNLSELSKSLGAALNSTSKQISNLSNSIIEKTLNTEPEIKIRPGFRANVFISRDIVLPEI